MEFCKQLMNASSQCLDGVEEQMGAPSDLTLEFMLKGIRMRESLADGKDKKQLKVERSMNIAKIKNKKHFFNNQERPCPEKKSLDSSNDAILDGETNPNKKAAKKKKRASAIIQDEASVSGEDSSDESDVDESDVDGNGNVVDLIDDSESVVPSQSEYHVFDQENDEIPQKRPSSFVLVEEDDIIEDPHQSSITSFFERKRKHL